MTTLENHRRANAVTDTKRQSTPSPSNDGGDSRQFRIQNSEFRIQNYPNPIHQSMMFHNRNAELAALRRHWRSDRAELLVVYGRRRIGKTFLLSHFSEDVPSIYYPAARLPEAQQLRELGQLFGAHRGDEILQENGFRDWDQLVRLMGSLDERVLIVLDEYPYLVESSPGLSSRLQRAWDHQLRSSRIMLVLCGSSMAMMEAETLAARAPLHGRRTGQLQVKAMGARESAAFLPGWSADDVVRAYTVFGGVPHYLAQLDPEKSFESNLFETMVQLGAPLRDEVEFLLRQELHEPRIYLGILAAIAAGKRKLSEIVNATGISTGSISKYLAVLQRLGMVEREVPITEPRPEKSKKGLYRITDQFTYFWLRHLHPIRGLLDSGREAEAHETLMNGVDLTAPATYEDICRDLVAGGALDETTGTRWAHVGRWWDRQAEIDVVALDPDRTRLLVGEVKWSTRPVGTDILDHLEQTTTRLPKHIQPLPRHHVLFSRSGFTQSLTNLSRTRSDLTLITNLATDLQEQLPL